MKEANGIRCHNWFMTHSPPQAVIIAGPNGSGKSTCAELLLEASMTFINADVIAQELGGEDTPNADLKAGRVLLERLSVLEEGRDDFALETTLSTRKLEGRVERLKTSGYEVHLLFLWLPSDDLAVERVAARVRAGGHFVPEPTIRRRFASGLRLFFNVFQPLVDTWRLYDNSRIADPRLIAWGRDQELFEAEQPALYEKIRSLWMEVDYDDKKSVDDRVRNAVRLAVKRNKELGNPLPEWDGERVQIIPAEQLPGDE